MYNDNNINIQSTQPGKIQCLLDTPDQGLGYVNDFRGALVEGYGNYLQGLTSWINSKLNLQMSAQVSYNLPMDMEANIPYVNAPEWESPQFASNIGGYRHHRQWQRPLGARHAAAFYRSRLRLCK
ncbi:uncharacterized protein N7498_003121 [Penicillium cinerascens]|uniref:Uncharacterized protein n=1 Tax=Penicillium cinerascens TaxID=70096 RepID=A0A9W9T7J1_9EURO|nr:uncharacterized protein N7498_003121 [Penicillium cinerascens]KAJ5211475.1 hypothetical protein N7498_003121 [Penicillium cinerascens]